MDIVTFCFLVMGSPADNLSKTENKGIITIILFNSEFTSLISDLTVSTSLWKENTIQV